MPSDRAVSLRLWKFFVAVAGVKEAGAAPRP
jgi:hypothetical protein